MGEYTFCPVPWEHRVDKFYHPTEDLVPSHRQVLIIHSGGEYRCQTVLKWVCEGLWMGMCPHKWVYISVQPPRGAR
jgi:hypothetical protein